MQKPAAVIAAETEFYQKFNANVHRGAHQLSQQATALFEQARDEVASLLNAAKRHEIIWCSGATAALNQLAAGLTAALCYSLGIGCHSPHWNTTPTSCLGNFMPDSMV